MEFEFDPGKSVANKAKHGIDFVEAQALWRDERSLEIDARSDDEERVARIGRIGEKHWVAIYTLRHHKVRLISMRRARDKEIQRYEDNLGRRVR